MGPDLTEEGIGLISIGRLNNSIDFLEEFGIKNGTQIWSTGNSWLPFDCVELDEWMVIANEGSHLIISERETDVTDLPLMPDGIELIFWDKEKLASVVGEAVLSGFLKLGYDKITNINESVNDKNFVDLGEEKPPDYFKKISLSDNLAFKSSINLDSILDELGIGGISTKPIFLRCRFWQIEGILIGPNKEEEIQQWLLLEDPFLESLDLLNDGEYLENTPSFATIERKFLLSEKGIMDVLPDFCNERRKQNVESEDGKVQISGKLLRWWKINMNQLKISNKIVLIPSWNIMHPLDGKCIIHGRSGQLISSTDEDNLN